MADTPMMDMLSGRSGRLRMHMPGGKGLPLPYALPLEWDVTELPDIDDLYAPGAGIARAQEAAARSAGAGHTLLLTGGSTAGLLAMLLYAVPPGGRVIVPRNAHHAVLSACVLGDLRPVYVAPRVAPDGLPYVPAEAFLAAMDAHPDAHALLVTAPDYYGVAPPLSDLAAAAEVRGMRLLVDQAHGAHWNWWDAPPAAGRQGARLWVQSAHKTLAVPTAGAWLHAAAGEDAERLRAMLRLVQTSSPSYLLMAALDQARADLDVRGREALEALRDRLPKAFPNGLRNAHEFWRALPMELDPTRIVVDVTGRGLSGYAAGRHLAEQGVDVEMADFRRIVCIATMADDAQAFDRLLRALDALPEGRERPAAPLSLPALPEVVLTPREAVLGPREWLPLWQAEGRVSAVSVGAYPPGVPLLAPGERISAQALEWLRKTQSLGGRLFGLDRDRIACAVLYTNSKH